MTAEPIDLDTRRRLASHIDSLPVLPMALAKLMALDPGDDDYFDEVLKVIEAEPNFGARILVAANSAASAPAQPVTTLAGAIARIGSRGATNLVLALSVTRVFVPRDPWERSLWRHGVQVAHAARALAGHADDDAINPEEVYACALLHDLGRFVLFQEAPDKLRAVDEGDWDTPMALVEQEQAICGITHPELGAMACRKWKLPDLVTRTVLNHHRPLPETFSTPDDKVVAIVRMADLAMFPSTIPGAESLDQTLDATALAEHLEKCTPPFLSIHPPQLVELVHQASVDADQACVALGIGA